MHRSSTRSLGCGSRRGALAARALLLLLLGVVGASCALESRFLQPRSEWLAEPSALGIDFEDVELDTGPRTTVHGWFIPSDRSGGRTVLLCHGNAGNISFLHPYYRFLRDAGWNVFAFDYRGFGKSAGELDLGALFTDTEAALDHLLARPDVDPGRIAIVGFSLGSIVALRTMAKRTEPFAYVVEDVASPRAELRSGLGAFLAWCMTAWALPADIEPASNAATIDRPGLFLVGERDRSLRAHLSAAAAAREPASVWVMPEAGHAPSGMLAHDGEYQLAFERFLDGAAAGRVPRIEARMLDWKDGELLVEIERVGGAEARSAVELCLVPEGGAPSFERRWLESRTAKWRIRAPARPEFVTAYEYVRVEDRGANGWRAAPGALARAAPMLPLIRDLAAGIVKSPEALARAHAIVATWNEFEVEHGAWPAIASAELVPALLSAGRALARHGGEEQGALARTLLERCMNAAPAVPAMHYWPSERYVAGFRYSAEIEEARELLAGLSTARRLHE